MLVCCLALLLSASAAQTAGNAGTVEGSVRDPSGAVIPGATVTIQYRVTGFQRTATTGSDGQFRFTAVPFNPYHVGVTAPGFGPGQTDVNLRSAVPLTVNVTLQLAESQTTLTVHSDAADLVESVPTAHTDLDRNLLAKLPSNGAGSGLNEAITLGAPGVVADSNGFFHPQGEHAGTSYSIDSQPITDQQSKYYSNQLPLNIFQSVEVISGAVPAEYGDKTSLVVNAVTRSGLGAKPSGSFSAQYGSFGTVGENATFAIGGARWGNFAAMNASRTGRFLDSPEFAPLHDRGNDQRFFDRVDLQPDAYDSLHLNLYLARSWFQVPNTFDQQFSGQDQRQLLRTLNVAPGWVHVFGPTLSLSVNPYWRQDRLEYFPSRDPFADQPATVSQNRRLANAGVRADVSWVRGIHNAKAGVAVSHTFLDEDFTFGITDPTFNAGVDFQPGLAPFDLTRGGRLLAFRGHADIREQSVYAQDTMTLGAATVTAGLRADRYDGLSTATAAEPRLGLAYLIKDTGTVLRASYARMFETPYNENLVLSSSTGAGGLAGGVPGAGIVPLEPGRRNQFDVGLQQAIARFVVVDAGYFWRYTRNAFDFDALFNTPIAFPIAWRKSKVDGMALRLTLTNFHGFTAFSVMGHTRARLFGPETGGLIFNSNVGEGVFRVDHDQAFEQTTHVRYQHGATGPWAAFTWRYDSGMVAGAPASVAEALALGADEQATIGLACGGLQATLAQPVRACEPAALGAARVRIPAPGTENADLNPPRIAPRHLFDLAVGTDNLFHSEHPRWTLRLSVLNLTNKAALYNFLSTFSGTHWVAPRTWQAEMGVVF